MDLINDKFGRNMLRIADQGLSDKYALKQTHRSNSFSSNWNEMLEIKMEDRNS